MCFITLIHSVRSDPLNLFFQDLTVDYYCIYFASSSFFSGCTMYVSLECIILNTTVVNYKSEFYLYYDLYLLCDIVLLLMKNVLSIMMRFLWIVKEYNLKYGTIIIVMDIFVTTQTQGYMTGTKGMGRHKVTNSQSKPSQFRTT